MSNDFDIKAVVTAIQDCLPEERRPIGLHEPVFAGKEWEYVKECLDTGWVSSVGKFVDRFEQDLAEYTGMKRAVAVVNGTAGLHIALKLSGVMHGDEVLVPTLTFIATANAVSYCGAIPHFVDSEERTLGLDPGKLADYLREIALVTADGCCRNRITGRIIRAVVPMHTFGHPVDLDPLADLCERYKIALVEDAAESLGSFYKGRHTGHWGKLAVLSFNGNKTITTGGGGAVLTNDEVLGKLAKHLTTTAKVPHRWAFNHDYIGYNYRMPNLNAALGCAQLEQLDSFLVRKRVLAKRYQAAFKSISGIKCFVEPGFARSNYWLNVLLLNNEHKELRDKILEATNDVGILTRPAWTPMHKLPVYAQAPRMDVSVAELFAEGLINIPSGVYYET